MDALASQRSGPVRTYRWAVFALALGYWLYQFKEVVDPGTGFGWQFRYLTIWALSASLLSSFAVLRLAMGWTDRRPETLAGTAAVMNAIVVYMYWKLYLDDPANVNGDGPIVWWQEYYLHALGPLLQWIDSVLILGAFRRFRPVAGALLAVVAVYLGWAEFVVAPLNARPVGEVTDGLPYPFLNDMAAAPRAVFYASTAALCLILAGAFWLLRRIAVRLARPAPEAPAARRGTTDRAT